MHPHLRWECFNVEFQVNGIGTDVTRVTGFFYSIALEHKASVQFSTAQPRYLDPTAALGDALLDKAECLSYTRLLKDYKVRTDVHQAVNLAHIKLVTDVTESPSR